MAKPDMPNYSLPGRILMGALAILVIFLLLRFFGFVPAIMLIQQW